MPNKPASSRGSAYPNKVNKPLLMYTVLYNTKYTSTLYFSIKQIWFANSQIVDSDRLEKYIV